jgi:hypothetical protein
MNPIATTPLATVAPLAAASAALEQPPADSWEMAGAPEADADDAEAGDLSMVQSGE